MPRKKSPRAYNPALEEQILRMRELLRLMAPETGSAALGAIRQAFPDAPLAARVAALGVHRGHLPAEPGSEPAGLPPAVPLAASA